MSANRIYTWLLGLAAIATILLLWPAKSPTLPSVGSVSMGAQEISGVASLNADNPDIVHFESDRQIRANIDPVDGAYSFAGRCLILTDDQMRLLRQMGGKVHVRGRAAAVLVPDNCPSPFQSGHGIRYALAYRAERLEPFRKVTCSPAAFVMGGYKCDGRFLESGLPAPAADLDHTLLDLRRYYPEELFNRHIPATVTVTYAIGRNGVDDCHVKESSGIQAVDNAACRMVRNEPVLWPKPRLNVQHSFQRTFSWSFEDAPPPPAVPKLGAIDLAKYYPPDLLEAGVTGVSEVIYTLGPKGVERCRPQKPDGNPRLDAAACRLITAERRARNHVAVTPVEVRQRVRWQIEDREAG
jgi:TonB family protein